MPRGSGGPEVRADSYGSQLPHCWMEPCREHISAYSSTDQRKCRRSAWLPCLLFQPIGIFLLKIVLEAAAEASAPLAAGHCPTSRS
jgi:hypothetical protein